MCRNFDRTYDDVIFTGGVLYAFCWDIFHAQTLCQKKVFFLPTFEYMTVYKAMIYNLEKGNPEYCQKYANIWSIVPYLWEAAYVNNFIYYTHICN